MMRLNGRVVGVFVLLLQIFSVANAPAQDIPDDLPDGLPENVPSEMPSLDDITQFGAAAFGDQVAQLIDEDVARVFIKTIGFGVDHRPYQPATPLGTWVGLDFGLEATLAHLPSDFLTSLASMGLVSGETKLPISALPSAKIHLHKGLGSRMDVGGSLLFYRGNYWAGADIKYAVYMPTGGPTWAVRLGYNRCNIGVVKTHTITPQVLVSKKLNFADPYIGIGYQYAIGKIVIPLEYIVGQVDVSQVPEQYRDLLSQDLGEVEKSARAGAFIAFLGVGISFWPTGLKLTLGGNYNSAGVHSLGLTFGFSL